VGKGRGQKGGRVEKAKRRRRERQKGSKKGVREGMDEVEGRGK